MEGIIFWRWTTLNKWTVRQPEGKIKNVCVTVAMRALYGSYERVHVWNSQNNKKKK